MYESRDFKSLPPIKPPPSTLDAEEEKIIKAVGIFVLAGVVASVAVVGVIIWGIVTLVLHFT